MTKETANKWWAEICALKEGKMIQARIKEHKSNNSWDWSIWFDDPNPQFNCNQFEFRIKPELRVRWIMEDFRGNLGEISYSSPPNSITAEYPRAIKFVESKE